MSQVRDHRDLIGGGLLASFGLFVVIYGIVHYPLGTLVSMGPGFFPVAIGALIALCGIAIGVPALRRPGVMPVFEVRPAIAVLGGGIAFSILIQHFGLVPAIVGLVLITAAGDTKLGWKAKLLLAVSLVAIAVLIFKIGLSMPVPYAKWPF